VLGRAEAVQRNIKSAPAGKLTGALGFWLDAKLVRMVQQFEMCISPKSAGIMSKYALADGQYTHEWVTVSMVFHITDGPARLSLLVMLRLPGGNATRSLGSSQMRYKLAADHCCESAIIDADALYQGSSTTELCRIIRSRGIHGFSTDRLAESIGTVTHDTIPTKTVGFATASPENQATELPMTAEQFSAISVCIAAGLACDDTYDE
jgi:hypothetical protein